ncbi:MAG: hypothetical protein GX416_09050 [Bacteroidales bacterium]|nr:hypothetical protein [Bacteroidales bacterium]
MLTEELFLALVEQASLAPSADNMQPWEFRRKNDSIEVYCSPLRMLPTDALSMFSWISIGAAIQNIVLAATKYNLCAKVIYKEVEDTTEPVAVITFSIGTTKSALTDFIRIRNTNRNPFQLESIETNCMERLNQSVEKFDARIHWTTDYKHFKQMAYMDAHSSYIRLAHKPLHDELFHILRFTTKEVNEKHYGLTFESLEVPTIAVRFAKQLRYWSINQMISNLGIGRLVAKHLSTKLMRAGGICLITVSRRNRIAYIEAGRAIEQLWLTVTAEGLSAQPYGVLPQYFTKKDIEPDFFPPLYKKAITAHEKPFYSIFPNAKNEFPALVLRLGRTDKPSLRSDERLPIEEIIHKTSKE